MNFTQNHPLAFSLSPCLERSNTNTNIVFRAVVEVVITNTRAYYYTEEHKIFLSLSFAPLQTHTNICSIYNTEVPTLIHMFSLSS